MKLADMTITEFSNVLASDAPAPGGGSAAALVGALGVALTNMVAALTVGREKYMEHQSLMDEIMTETAELRQELIRIIDRDTEAFHGVSAVFAMPKGTDEEKAARKETMQAALKACAITPYEVMLCSLSALELTDKALGRSNASAASDLGVAALSLKAAIQGAWLNVLINLGGIHDEAFVNEYKRGGEGVLERSLPLADRIYNAVLESL